ncbi:MAG: leucyl/phenylalanyl-tRNA--protein transferase [Marinobacter sp.]|nr:leucyl/phenylalanyl-tRNA--protein transferase [Marinobacter sp.]
MSTLPWLDPDFLWFPPPDEALRDPDGLLAAGGDLAPERLVLAYRSGIFPWYGENQPILWWSPDPRCVIVPGEEHVSRSLRRTLNQQRFRITSDQAFREVIRRCGSARPEGTWIIPEMIEAYETLHQQGLAHSFEAWNREGELVGGLYGVALGRCFFGESMFSRETNASKVVFVTLCQQLARWGYRLLDCQVENDHLLTLGAHTIPRTEFLSILQENVDQLPDQTGWQIDSPWPSSGEV